MNRMKNELSTHLPHIKCQFQMCSGGKCGILGHLIHWLVRKIPIHFIVTELGFYMVNHGFQAPTAMACVYAHPLGFLVGNLFPIFFGPILTNAHPCTSYIWIAAAMIGTCKGHSGYRIFGHADYHEEHHLLYKYNYGGMYVLDTLFGTRR